MINFSDLYFFHVADNRYVAHLPSCLIFNISSEQYDDLERHLVNSEFYALAIDNLSESISIHKRRVEYIGTDSQSFKPNCIVLNISGKCNLSCKYCFSQDRHGFKFNSMTVKECVDAISFMINNCPEESNYSVNFFGGEPLLESDTLIDTVTRVCELFPEKSFQFSITTNGTIMDKQMVAFFRKYQISLLISFDGPKEIVNKYRKHKNDSIDTYSLVLANTELLKKEDIPFCFRATVVPSSQRLMEIVLLFESHEVPYYLVPCFNPGNDNKGAFLDWDNESFFEEYERVSSFFLSKIEKNEPIFCYSFISKIKAVHQQFFSKYPCGIGINLFSVTNTGNIFPCMNFATHPETVIGNIYSGINQDRRMQFMPFDVDSINGCKDCIIRYQCAGGCLSGRYDTNNKSILPPDERMCELKKLIWKNIIRSYQRIKTINPIFLDNLPQTITVE